MTGMTGSPIFPVHAHTRAHTHTADKGQPVIPVIAVAPADRFTLMVSSLMGAPAPPLPAIAGRLITYEQPTDGDPYAEAWEELVGHAASEASAELQTCMTREPHDEVSGEVSQ